MALILRLLQLLSTTLCNSSLQLPLATPFGTPVSNATLLSHSLQLLLFDRFATAFLFSILDILLQRCLAASDCRSFLRSRFCLPSVVILGGGGGDDVAVVVAQNLTG